MSSSELPPSVPPERTSVRTAPVGGSASPAATIPPASYAPSQGVGVSTEPARSAAPADAGTGSQPQSGSTGAVRTPSAKKAPGPRRVRLSISRVDPWSVMKLSFLLSIAAGIMLVVATALVWTVLNQMEVFAKIESLVEDVGAVNQFGPILEYLEFSRVISVATVIGIVDIVLLTALATLGAFIYNFVAAMVGGLHLTMTDD